MNTVSARKKLVDKLVDKLEKFADESVCVCSYTICVILAAIALAISIGIGAYFAYSCWYLKKDVTHVKFGTGTQWNCTQTPI